MRTLLVTLVLLVACKDSAKKPGGPRMQIVYDLDLDAAVDERASVLRADLEAAMLEQKIRASVQVPLTPLGALRVTPEELATIDVIKQLVTTNYGDTVELRTCEVGDRPSAVCFKISDMHADAIRKAALANAVETIRERLDAVKVQDPSVVQKAGQIVVSFPSADTQGVAIRNLIARTGKLEFKVVDNNSEYMKRLFVHVGSDRASGDPTEPVAIEQAIRAEPEIWRPEEGANTMTDYFLIAQDRGSVSGRTVLERYIAALVASDPSFRIPEDRQIGYERVMPHPNAKDEKPYWRTYFLERTARVTGSVIQNAMGTFDPNTNRPIVLLDFNRAGARDFAKLTEEIVGKKLATILDDTIKSAPIVNGAIRGGRVSITMGGSDPRVQEIERDELVNVLKTGSLPAPLREVSSTIVP